MDKQKQREIFERLPEIAERLEWCYFQESTGEYWSKIAHSEDFEYQTNYVNGAWMMYQEQQNKIDKALEYVSTSPLKDVSRRAMVNLLEILK